MELQDQCATSLCAFIVNFEQILHISIVDLEQAKAGKYKTKLKTKTLEKRAGYFVESDQS